MRAIKLFLAVATVAGFAACTKDVLVEPEKAIDSFDDVKAGKVIANGFSINPTGPETKVAIVDGKASYEDGDKAGVAWFVSKGNPTADQTVDGFQDLYSTAYANHKLEYKLADERFYSNSNVFEGWHVAYYPYQEMKKPSVIGFRVNPAMTTAISGSEDYAVEEYENSRVFSSAHFITAEHVNDGIITTDMPLSYVTNVLRPQFTVDENFKDDKLKDLQIKSVTLSAGDKMLFADSLTVNPRKFPTDTNVFNGNHFGVKVGSSVLGGPAFQTDSYVSSVVTELNTLIQKDYTLGAENLYFRMFIAPLPAGNAVTAADLSIRVELEGGSSFNLTAEGPNKDKFEALAKVLSGTHESIKFTELCSKPVALKLQLTESEYSVAYNVSNYDEWKECIDLATVLGSDEVTFNLANTAVIEFPSDEDGGMYVPEGLKINCRANAGEYAYFKFGKATTWSPNVTVNARVCVEVAGELTLNNDIAPNRVTVKKEGVLLLGDNTINPFYFHNYGTIEVSLKSVLKAYEAKSVDAKVVYNVEGTETVEAVTDMIENAHVTDFVMVGGTWTLDKALTNVEKAIWKTVSLEMNEDAAISGTATFAAVKMSGKNTFTGNLTALVTVADDATINGTVNGKVTVEGTLKVEDKITGDVNVAEGAALTAKDIAGAVTVNKNAIVVTGNITKGLTVAEGANVTVNGNLTSTKGVTVAKDATLTVTGDVTGNVTVAEGGRVALTNVSGTLTNSGVVTITSDEFVEIGSIINNGELTTEGANVYVDNITTKPGSTTKVAEEYAIYYISSYTNDGGTTIGKIVKSTGYDNTHDDYKLAEGTYYVKTPGGLETVLALDEENYNICLESDVTVDAGDIYGGTNAKSIMIDANGKTISFNQPSPADWNPISTKNNAVLNITNGSIKSTGATTGEYYQHSLVFDCPVVMNDVISNTAVLVRYSGKETCTFEKVTFEDKTLGGDKKGYYALWIEPYGQTVEVKDCVFNMTAGKSGLGGRGIKVEQINATVAPIAGATLNISGTDFNTMAKAAVTVHCNKPVVINWLAGNNIDDVAEDKEHAVWIDSRDITSDFVNNVTVNGHTKTIEGFNM